MAGGAEEAIRELFGAYQRTLNTSNLNAAMDLYAPEAVFMMPQSPPSIGKPAISEAYTRLFHQVDHIVQISVNEITVVSNDWAFARTTTTGTCKIRATGEQVPDAVQQLWVLRRVDEGWRIARYSFSPTGPAL